MVKVIYRDRLGNKLFQYALGRYLAEEMGYALRAEPLPFAATQQDITGLSFHEPRYTIGPYHIDIPAVLEKRNGCQIVLDGWFQHYRYYAPFFDRIRKWFTFPRLPLPQKRAHKNDLLIYLRLGDYCHCGWNLQYVFYEAIIKMVQPRRLYIVTENANHPFLRNFAAHAPVIISRDTVSDLALARSFGKIVLSCSTFSWWAAMLAEPEEIYFPIAEAGLWSPQRMHPPNYDQDLRIDDSRFVYFYNCPIKSSERHEAGYRALVDSPPNQAGLESFWQTARDFHKESKAYWLI
jgi:hypothetical protein